MQNNEIPIITVDGTTASGKGTIATRLAQHFSFHYLNSGAMYRLIAYQALHQGVELSLNESLLDIARNLEATFEGKQVIVDGIDIWPIISTQAYGTHASIIAPIAELRAILYQKQRDMVRLPGLVADGRDMGKTVYKNALVKLYLEASVEVRAKRRLHDEEERKTGKSYEAIYTEIEERDRKDKEREHGKLAPADDAIVIDTTEMTIDEVMARAIEVCKEKGLTV